MANLIRLIYTSHATFTSRANGENMEPVVEKILMQSRVNNARAKIGGVLYFADDYFFQCIEGSENAVFKLVETLELDNRHSDMKISYCKHVRRRCFKDWTMKYVPVSEDVLALMHARGYDSFNPCQFDEADINALVDLFTRLEDTSLEQEHLRTSHRLPAPWWRRLIRPMEQARRV